MDDPAETPVTTPLLLTLATAVFDETQGVVVAAVAEPVSVVVKPAQTVSVPVIVGSAFTVTVAVMIQPFELVYVITEVPTATPVTTPVLFTVATAVFEETQGFVADGAADPLSTVVEAIQTSKVPVMVGSAFTVTVAVMLQPSELV